MATMRMCLACNRPNGPHFSRCMTCGAWIGVASPAQGGPTDPADSSHRAVRMLEGLTPERRELLPEDFLRSLQKQARGIDDAAGESGVHRALEIPRTNPEARVDDISETSLELSLELSLEMPLDIIESEPPDAPWARTGTASGDHAAFVERTSSGDLQVELPPVGEAGDDDGLGPLWEDSRSVRALSAVEADSDEMISVLDDFPDLLDDESWGGPLDAPRESGDVDWTTDPLAHALTEGHGPFGDREARFRLFLLPSDRYAGDEDRLRADLADIMGIDVYSAGLLINKPVPSLLASGDNPRELNNQARDLRLSGMEILLVERGFWLDGILPLAVRSAAGAGPGNVTLLMEEGGVESVPRERIGYGVLGAVDVPGGRTIWLLDLYLVDAPVCLRLRSDRFDFSVLGALAEGPPARLMHRMVHWFSVDPSNPLPLDEAFRLVPPASRSTKAVNHEIEPGVADFTEYSLLCDQGRRVE